MLPVSQQCAYAISSTIWQQWFIEQGADTPYLSGSLTATGLKADLILLIKRMGREVLEEFMRLVGDTYIMHSIHTEIERQGKNMLTK